jgi:glycosyltransferase involved in cell wall biosynthesis
VKTVTLSANTSWYLYNFRASTIKALQLAGYRVLCISPNDGYGEKLVESLGCEWVPVTIDNMGSNIFKDFFLVVSFYRLYRKYRPVAVLHFTIKNNVYGTWAATLARVPAINNVSGLGTAFIRTGLVARIVRLLYKTSQPLAKRVFCQNAEDQQLLIDQGLVPASRLTLLPGSGVDLDRFNPKFRQPHDGPFRFLYAGRMLADKGLYELVSAARTLHSAGHRFELWLCGFTGVGNVSAIPERQLQAWEGEPFINWLGPTDVMESILIQVDCMVLPSYREGLPRSLLEAGAMGLPSIATDVPGCRHVIRHGENGLLCKAKDSKLLSDAMAKILSMPKVELSLMGMLARSVVEEHFGENVVVKETLAAVLDCQHGG